ncbi:GDSL esterase/lipase At5g33370 [Linum perenne]
MGSSPISSQWLAVVLVLALVLGPQVSDAARAFFVFGDSLVDNGNNNYLATTARADSPPYGIDYPTHRATGRFSNGFNIPDLRLLVGANFASAGIGILNDTGIQFLNIIRITRQLQLFQQYQQRVSGLIGVEQAQRLVRESLVLITLGGNDFVNNYYLRIIKLMQRLYELGARRVLVTGTGPMGCVPAERAMRGINGECSVELQRAAALFNPQLVDLVNSLNSEIGSNVFIAANAHLINMDFVSNPQAYGFVTSKVACCGQGPYNGLGLCTPASNLCPNRDIYAFWDPFHPSERANRMIVQSILTGDTRVMHPMNLSTVLEMDNSRT